MKSFKILIAVGIINLIHGSIHIFQFIQSVLLTYNSLNHKSNWINKIMENPWMGIVWGLIGIITIVIGINDYKHHKAEEIHTYCTCKKPKISLSDKYYCLICNKNIK